MTRASDNSSARAPLSRKRVLRAAVAIADDGGIGALTMRKLAGSLNVEAMSLYHHFANKDEILDGIIDLAASEIDLTDDGNWKATTRRRAISIRDTLLQHSWAGMLWVSRLNVGPARMRYMDTALRVFREAGFAEDLTHHAFHAVENHVVGYTMQQLSFAVDTANLDTIAARFISELPADEYPDLALHVHQHAEPAAGEDTETDFDFGLRLILDGIERIHMSD